MVGFQEFLLTRPKRNRKYLKLSWKSTTCVSSPRLSPSLRLPPPPRLRRDETTRQGRLPRSFDATHRPIKLAGFPFPLIPNFKEQAPKRRRHYNIPRLAGNTTIKIEPVSEPQVLPQANPLQLPYPDIAELDGVSAVILQDQRLLERMGFVFGWLLAGRSFDPDVVLDQNSILQHGDRGFLRQFAILIEPRGVENDIVGLPFTGFTADVNQGSILAVNGAGLAVEVGLVLVGVQNLEFVAPLENNAAVAATLAFPLDLRRCCPLNMQLAISKRLFRGDVAGAVDGRHAVFYLPS